MQRNIEKMQDTWEMLNKCVIERTGLDILLMWLMVIKYMLNI